MYITSCVRNIREGTAMAAEKNKKQATDGNNIIPSLSVSPLPSVRPWQAFLVHLISGLGLASALGVAHKVYSISLISDPLHTLLLNWVIEAPILILIYSLFRKNREQCSYWKAVGRGILGLPTGAVVNALVAIALGAPVSLGYFLKTLNWSLLMSSFTVIPTASTFGASWMDWLRIFGHTTPTVSIDYMICLPAHGAIIGAWFGAWPMPLDWERPWQEWPICVSYGAITGYLIGMVASFGFILLRGERHHVKRE